MGIWRDAEDILHRNLVIRLLGIIPETKAKAHELRDGWLDSPTGAEKRLGTHEHADDLPSQQRYQHSGCPSGDPLGGIDPPATRSLQGCQMLLATASRLYWTASVAAYSHRPLPEAHSCRRHKWQRYLHLSKVLLAVRIVLLKTYTCRFYVSLYHQRGSQHQTCTSWETNWYICWCCALSSFSL